MKILHINCADYGSTGKIITDISRMAFSQQHRSYLCVPDVSVQEDFIEKKAICIKHETGAYKRVTKLLGLRYGFAPVSTAKILKTIKDIEPDVVHIHSANCYMVNLYTLLKYLKKRKIATVVTNHAEFFYTGTCPQAEECTRWKTGCGQCPDIKSRAESVIFDRTATAWRKMKSAFSGFSRICMVSVSPWVYERAKMSPITEGIPQKTILNGVDTEVFCNKGESCIREKLGIKPDEKMILCVTAMFNPDNKKDIKGSGALVELSSKLMNEKVKIVIVGQCAEFTSKLPENMILTGPVYDQEELAQYYSAADLSVITSKRETFSMIVAESLCCGTPVVGFEAGGPESIAMTEYSEFFPQGDVDAIYNGICDKWLFQKQSYNPCILSKEAAKIYSGTVMAQKYLDLYEEMI